MVEKDSVEPDSEKPEHVNTKEDGTIDEKLSEFFEEQVDSDLFALTAERDELKDRLLRALAEAENARKRGERDRKDAALFGGTKLARDLLGVHDNLSRALGTVDESLREQFPAFVEGIELTRKELLAAFAKHKIEQISPEIGAKFDANQHQAMFEAPVPGHAPGSVIQVMAEGFSISGRLLRPAQVGVAAQTSEPPQSEPEPEPQANT